jgi:hypothetical protein
MTDTTQTTAQAITSTTAQTVPVFLTELDTECVDDLACNGRGIWRVKQPFKYYSQILGEVITVEPDFLTDYCSVPRLPFMYWLLGDRAHKSGVLHDWLYHHHEVCDEETANRVLLEAMVVENIPKLDRLDIYLGVKFGGKSSWEEDGKGSGHSIVDGRIV